jgi:NagD protein
MPLRKIRHLFLDLDGTLYRGNTLLAPTLPFLDTLEKRNLGFTFLTNNATKSRRDYLAHLRDLGINATDAQLCTSAHAALHYLRRTLPGVRRLLLLGSPGLARELAESGYEISDTPEAVLVSWDPRVTFDEICHAAWWIARGLPYIATHPDATCPTDRPHRLMLECGSICAAIANATGRHPDKITGKPDPLMVHSVMEQQNLRPDQVLVVGDRLDTDMALARNIGSPGALVLTGCTDAAAAASTPHPPDIVFTDIGQVTRLLPDTSPSPSPPPLSPHTHAIPPPVIDQPVVDYHHHTINRHGNKNHHEPPDTHAPLCPPRSIARCARKHPCCVCHRMGATGRRSRTRHPSHRRRADPPHARCRHPAHHLRRRQNLRANF